MQNMAYQSGLRDEYDLIYPIASEASHGEDINDHVDYKEGSGIIIKLLPSDKYNNPVLPTAIIFLLMIAETINEACSFGKDKEIEEYKNRFYAFQKSDNQPKDGKSGEGESRNGKNH